MTETTMSPDEYRRQRRLRLIDANGLRQYLSRDPRSISGRNAKKESQRSLARLRRDYYAGA